VKTPLLFFNHALEAIFYFNDIDNHPMYNKYNQTERERSMFCFPGKHNEQYALLVYGCFICCTVRCVVLNAHLIALMGTENG